MVIWLWVHKLPTELQTISSEPTFVSCQCVQKTHVVKWKEHLSDAILIGLNSPLAKNLGAIFYRTWWL